MFLILQYIANAKAWDGLNLTAVTDNDIVDVLSYHVRPLPRSANGRSLLLP